MDPNRDSSREPRRHIRPHTPVVRAAYNPDILSCRSRTTPSTEPTAPPALRSVSFRVPETVSRSPSPAVRETIYEEPEDEEEFEDTEEGVHSLSRSLVLPPSLDQTLDQALSIGSDLSASLSIFDDLPSLSTSFFRRRSQSPEQHQNITVTPL